MIAASQNAKQASNYLGSSGKSLYGAQQAGIALSGLHKAKSLKYDLLRESSSLLFDRDKEAAEQHPTCWCHGGVPNPTDSIDILRRRDGESARMSGIITCKNVWACPVCSSRICVTRQGEVEQAMKAHIANGGYVFLMTRTFPHELDMPLGDLLQKEGKARTLFRNSRRWRAGKEARTGYICSLEVTLGERSGWHPHTHELVFATPDAFGDTREQQGGRLMSRLIDELKEAWYLALRKVGLCEQSEMSDVLAHGLDVRGGQYAAEYISKFGKDQKWGLSNEITRHAAKTGGGLKGLHPFQLLMMSMEGDVVAGQKFREYVSAFQGKRMLSWSKGLKKLLIGAEDIDDEDIADDQLPDEVQIGKIGSEEVSILRKRGLFGNFLGFVAEYCSDPDTAKADIDSYFAWARTIPPNRRGLVKVKMWSRGAADPAFAAKGRGFMFVDQEKRMA